MVLLNFKGQFADAVAAGKKTQTIRPIRKHPIQVGHKLQLYTGLRTKSARKLIEPDPYCTLLEYIHFLGRGEPIITYSRENGSWEPFELTEENEHDLAVKDGFEGVEQMLDFFESLYGLPFKGTLIQWGKEFPMPEMPSFLDSV